MTELVKASYNDLAVTFTPEAWFNATAVAEKFGKLPYEWLRLPSTKHYIEALKSTYGKIPYVKNSRARADRGGGTWLHPKLAVEFARWLDVGFSIWCNDQIEHILRGSHPHFDWKRQRYETMAGFNAMCAALQARRDMRNKPTEQHHFINEAKLLGFVLTGAFCVPDRATLSLENLEVLAKLEARNAVLIIQDMCYVDRKTALATWVAEQWKALKSIPVPVVAERDSYV